MLRLKLILSVVFSASLALVSEGQLSREGTPYSWFLSDDVIPTTIWESIPSMNVNQLLSEDNFQSNKSKPYRFASATDVDFTLENSGHWINLPNGDRLWMLGIRCDNALALSVAFAGLRLPKEAKLYVYASDRSDVIGPINPPVSSTDGQMSIVPLAGQSIIIEYYEPLDNRGEGSLMINSVARAYKHVDSESFGQQTQCLRSFEHQNSAKPLRDGAASVAMMIVDNGQRLATGAFVNNSKFDGTPYMITATESLMGEPQQWVFVLDYAQNSCEEEFACWDHALCGADILALDEVTGLSLIQTKQTPKKTWDVFYSGWELYLANSQRFTCIQHAFGAVQSVSYFNGNLIRMYMNGQIKYDVDEWDSGSTFAGSIGSPLFSANNQIIGFFVGGNLGCSNNGRDSFASISDAWNTFKSFLDPINRNSISISGLYSEYAPEQTVSIAPLVLFPNPSAGSLYLQNNSGEAVDYIAIYDAMGRYVVTLYPSSPRLDVSFLESGNYIFQIGQKSSLNTSRVIIH
ncbi:MAG: hypothetical protein RLZZ77_549 [Bacteroidota bacterium]